MGFPRLALGFAMRQNTLGKRVRNQKESDLPTSRQIDRGLIDEARKAGKHRSDKAAIVAALRSYTRLRKQRGILDLIGKIDYYPDYDYKALRRKR